MNDACPGTSPRYAGAEREDAAAEVAPLEAAVERRDAGSGWLSGATWPPHGHGPPGSPLPGTTTGRHELRVHPGDEAAARRTRCRGVDGRAPSGPVAPRRRSSRCRAVQGAAGPVRSWWWAPAWWWAPSWSLPAAFGLVAAAAPWRRARNRGGQRRERHHRHDCRRPSPRTPHRPGSMPRRGVGCAGRRSRRDGHPTWRVLALPVGRAELELLQLAGGGARELVAELDRRSGTCSARGARGSAR